MNKIPSDAFVYDGHKYYVYSNVADTWEAAEAYCESLGGHLAVINDSEENNAIVSYLFSRNEDKIYYIGFSDAEHEGNWTWVTGEAVTYTNWASGEPNNHGERGAENYACIVPRNGKFIDKWNDRYFFSGDYFICEWDTPYFLKITNADPSKITVDSDIEKIDASSRTKAIKITGNALNNSIVGGSGNDYLIGGSGNDLIKGGKGNDSLTGGAGNDSLTGGAGNDIFIYTGGKDVISDYSAGEDKIKLSAAISKANLSGSDVIFTIGNGNLTVKDGKGKKLSIINSSGKEYDTIVSGETELTVNDKTKSPVTAGNEIKVINATKRTTPIQIIGNNIANTINGGSNNDTIRGGKGNDKLFGESGNDSLAGDAGNDTLSGGKGNDKLLGGAGNDSLAGGTGNDTLTGGAGNDIFFYTGGKDTITDYETGDTIALGAEISKSAVKSSNVVFTVGKGTLTIKDGKGKTLKMTDSDGESYVTVVGGTTLSITDDIKSPITAGSTIKVINASKRKTAVEIIGNDIANTINGGSKGDTIRGAGGNDYLLGNAGNDKIYGGDGDDNIWGGKGNDSLWGDAGADTFVYMTGDGKDVIFGFDNDDFLQIMDDFTPAYKNGAVTLTVGSGSITLKNFTATTFNINDETYKISGSSFKKQ
ncbi:MAG: hypothetical protein II857_06345 [Selenomonadaceae bacterium]|nr:hypothetical protein [Selenomonadaceae bacterium]